MQIAVAELGGTSSTRFKFSRIESDEPDDDHAVRLCRLVVGSEREKDGMAERSVIGVPLPSFQVR